MNIVVVVPGYNESRYISKVLHKISKFSKAIVYVDDGSNDRSARLARKFTKHVVRHPVNLGKGAAMKTGAEYAFDLLHASAVIFMDADDQHDPSEIHKFIQKIKRNDVVFGVRNIGMNMPMLRYIGNKIASVSLNILFGGYIEDIPSGFKAITKKAYRKIVWNSTGYEVETEIAVRVLKEKLRFGVVEIKAIYHDTDKGMTILDAIHICSCMLQWRLGL